MNDFNELVKVQDEYIALLVKEIESMVSIAYMHGWRSDNHEAGSLLREKIASLKQDATKAEQEGPTQASLMLDELCELVFNDRLYGTSAGVSGRPHDSDPEISKVKRKILDLISTTPPVKEVAYDELWDEFSEYIDDDIDSLSIFAGRTVLTEAQYNKLVAKLKAAPVNEAGQPRNLPIEELIKLSDEELNVEINKVRSRLGMGKSDPSGRSTDEDQYELYKAGYANGHRDGKREVSRLQPAPSGFRWVPITQWGKVKRDITKVLVKYDTGEIRRFSEDDQPANLQTHFMDLSDSPAPVQVNLVAFANWIGEQAYYPDQISRNWAWEGCIPGQEITTECLLEKYIQSLQNNKP